MSNYVQGLCFKALFKCPRRKAVAVAMADHAHDDGTSIWPSVAKLVIKTEWSERSVQRALRELQQLGIVVLVEKGGSGPKDTNEYKFDLEVLLDLSDRVVEVVNCGDNKGVSVTPMTLVRVSASPIRVSGVTNKGVRVTPEPPREPQEPSRAPASAREEVARSRIAEARKKVALQLEITPADPTWGHWITWLTDRDRRDLVQAAESAEVMWTGSRWPAADSPVPQIGKLGGGGMIGRCWI